MFINKQTRLRVNPYAPVEIDGIRYPSYPAELMEEIPDPQPPAVAEDLTLDEMYYRNEQNDAPYVVWTQKSNEQLATIRTSKADRAARIQLVTDSKLEAFFADIANDTVAQLNHRIETHFPNPAFTNQQQKILKACLVAAAILLRDK